MPRLLGVAIVLLIVLYIILALIGISDRPTEIYSGQTLPVTAGELMQLNPD